MTLKEAIIQAKQEAESRIDDLEANQGSSHDIQYWVGRRDVCDRLLSKTYEEENYVHRFNEYLAEAENGN